MEEYIKREFALDVVKRTSGDYAAAFAEIAHAPAADVVPVVHGRWVRPHWRNSIHCMDCSECGGEAHHRDYRGVEKYYSMCPHCGAKMDGGQP